MLRTEHIPPWPNVRAGASNRARISKVPRKNPRKQHAKSVSVLVLPLHVYYISVALEWIRRHVSPHPSTKECTDTLETMLQYPGM